MPPPGRARRADERAPGLSDGCFGHAWTTTLAVGSATKRLVVLDEAWALLSHLSTARWLQATFKLSRSYGVANVAVVHPLSDLKAAGQEGSEQQRLAEGLLADAETRVVFGQAPGEAERARRTARPVP
jgi:hypothetical protein